MTVFSRALRWVTGRARAEAAPTAAAAPRQPADILPFDIAPGDPLVAYFQGASGPVDIEALALESPARDALRAAGVKLVVPLVAQGELIGLLNLGQRLSEAGYSADDRKLLDDLASHAAPALRVAQLVRQQEAEVRARERLEQELRVAHLIQQNFLPKETPKLAGWHVAAYYRPARAVGGDFYDFIDLPDGQLGLVIGDVTDHGVPAALVMASTRSVLRAAAQRLVSPGEVLARVNDYLVGDIPPNMFVTCLYGVLHPASGRLRYANAGHNVPYVRSDSMVKELRATGMPLGLMPDIAYDEKEADITPGETILLSSDGLAEAHAPNREMFGLKRLQRLIATVDRPEELIDVLLMELDRFTGASWEQEDDITLVIVERTARPAMGAQPVTRPSVTAAPRVIDEFKVPSAPGNERGAMTRVAKAAVELGLPKAQLERLKTAVSEATMNAMEHGNGYRPDLDVRIEVAASDAEFVVRVTDHGGGRPIPEAETPDLEAKLAGLQRARGWGLFLIKNMVDDLRVSSDERHHTVELVVHRKGHDDGDGAIRG